MKSLIEFLLGEAKKPKAVVVTFGRFSPISRGHEKLAERIRDEAKKRGAKGILYPSQSFDEKKNPLPIKDKIRLLKKAFPYVKISTDKSLRNIFQIAEKLSSEGVKDFTLVVGSDRVAEFKKSLGKYIKNKNSTFNLDFDNFEVISAGARDNNKDNVSGVSASKMRKFVKDGDMISFKHALPSKLKSDFTEIFKIIKNGMGLK